MFVNLNANGTVYKTVGDRVFRKSNNANVIALFAPFAKDVNVYINFKLPNNTIYSGTMTFKEFSEENQKNLWVYNVLNNITEYAGTVEVSFEIHTVKPDEVITTAKVNITVEECLDNNIVVSQPDEFLNAINLAQATADGAVTENDNQNTVIAGIQQDIADLQQEDIDINTDLTNHINTQTTKEAEQDTALADKVNTVGYTNADGKTPKITYTKDGVTTEVSVTDLVCDITLNEADGVLTVTKAGNVVTTLDINIESGVAAAGSTYDSANKLLKIMLLSGSTVDISLADIYTPINTLKERLDAQEVINNENVGKIATIEGNYLKKDGTVQMNVGYAPTQAKQLADKAYVDSAILGVTGVDMSTYVTQTQLTDAIDKPSFVTETFSNAVNNPVNAVRLAPQELLSFEGLTSEVGGLLKSVINPYVKINGRNKFNVANGVTTYNLNSANLTITVINNNKITITGTTGNTGIAVRLTDTIALNTFDSTGRSALSINKPIITTGNATLSLTGLNNYTVHLMASDGTSLKYGTTSPLTANGNLSAIVLGLPTNTTINLTLDSIMLNIGTTALTYEAYKECYSQFTSTFRGVGTAKDKIVPRNGLWYKQKYMTDDIALGSFSGTVTYSTSLTNCYQFNFANFFSLNSLKINTNNAQNGIINGFTFANTLDDVKHWKITNNGLDLYWYIEKATVDSQTGATLQDKFKACLTSIGAKFVGELATMTETQLTVTTNNANEGCVFEQYSTIYMTSDTGILPTLKYNCAADVAAQVTLLSRDNQEQAQQLDSILDTIGTSNDSLDSRLDTLEVNTADLPQIRTDIDTLQNDVIDTQQDVAGLGTRMTTAEGEIDTLQTDVNAVEVIVANHTARLESAETTIVNHTNAIATLEAKTPHTVFYNGVAKIVPNSTNFDLNAVTVATVDDYLDYEYLIVEFYSKGTFSGRFLNMIPIRADEDMAITGIWTNGGLSINTITCMVRLVVANSLDLTLKAYNAAWRTTTYPAGTGTLTGGALSEAYSNVYITKVIGVKK